MELTQLQTQILTVLRTANAIDENSALTALDIVSMIPKSSVESITASLLPLRKHKLARMVQIGKSCFFITNEGINAISSTTIKEPKKAVKKVVKMQEEPAEEPTTAPKINHADIPKPDTSVADNGDSDLMAELNKERFEHGISKMKILMLEDELATLKSQQPPSATWIQEQDPTAEYAISSAYMQRKPSLEELLQRAEAETVKHAKPRTIYQIKKLGVMMPNVTAEFKETK